MKYFSLKVVCEDYDAIRHDQTYVVGILLLLLSTMKAALTKLKL